MHRCKFGGSAIASAGYDAQCGLLEIEFAYDGQVWQYMEVPEELWYRFKSVPWTDGFFRNFIQGCYDEKRILPSLN